MSVKPYDQRRATQSHPPLTDMGCAMCGIGRGTRPLPIWDTPLIESENFVVVPSLGSLVEGWTLIVPRSHYLSAASLPLELAQELDVLKGIVRDVIVSQYGYGCFFEHGPSALQRTTGCSVDHAHVHAVPVRRAVLDTAKRLIPEGASFRPGGLVECRAAVSGGLDYLYFEGFGEESEVATAPAFASQTFRLAVAECLGRPTTFDWRSYPMIDIAQATVERLGPLVRNREGAGLLVAGKP